MNRKSLIIAFTLFMIFSFGTAFGQNGSIYISDIDGDTSGAGPVVVGDTLKTGVPIVWTMNINNTTGEIITGPTNGFRVYSPDGATWTPLDTGSSGGIDEFGSVYTTGFGPKNANFFLYAASTNSGSGTEGDTVGIGGISFSPSPVGFPIGMDAPGIVVTIPSPGIDPASAGKTICITESGYQFNSTWIWASLTGGYVPIWGPEPSGYGGPQCYAIQASGTAVDESITDILPTSFDLEQNYPNPFNPTTNIWFQLPERSQVILKVYNLLGNEITTLVDEELPAGRHLTVWNGRDRTGTEVATGIYFYKMVATDFVETRKMMLVR